MIRLLVSTVRWNSDGEIWKWYDVIFMCKELMRAAGIKFLETNPTGTPVNEEAFDKACGVGEL